MWLKRWDWQAKAPALLGAEFGEFGIAAVVDGFVDEAFGFGEVAFGEMVVGEVKAHAGAGGDFEDFLEVVGSAAGEMGEGKDVERPGAPEEVNGLVEVVSGFGGVVGVGATEGDVVEANVEGHTTLLCDAQD